MNRCAEFLEKFSNEMPTEIENIYAIIIDDFWKNKEKYTRDFTKSMETAFRSYLRLQEEGKKGSVNSILISPALYGIYTGSYEHTIAVFDEMMYENIDGVITYWNADFVYRYVDEHMPLIEAFLKKNFLRVKSYEIEEFRRMYAMLFHELLHIPLIYMSESIETNAYFKSMKKAGVVAVLYGAYMDTCSIIKEINTEAGK